MPKRLALEGVERSETGIIVGAGEGDAAMSRV